MSVNPIQGQGGPPAQISNTKSKSGEESFNEFTKSDGYNSEELKDAVADRSQLTRSKGVNPKSAKNTSLFRMSKDGELEEEAVFRTVIVDGRPVTLRLLAVA